MDIELEFLGNKPVKYGAEVASWSECLQLCKATAACAQVVFYKTDRKCYGMRAAYTQEQEGKGGKNVKWISARCLEREDEKKDIIHVLNGLTVKGSKNSFSPYSTCPIGYVPHARACAHAHASPLSISFMFRTHARVHMRMRLALPFPSSIPSNPFHANRLYF